MVAETAPLMKNLLSAVAFFLLLSAPWQSRAQDQAPIDPAKRAEIEKLLKTSGVEDRLNMVATQLIASMKQATPGVPDEFWNKFQQKMNFKDLIEKMIPIYDKYYTLDDLKAINAFYDTPAGKKLISVMPQVTMEAMKVGQEWGAEVGKQAEEEIEKEKAAAGNQ